MKLQKYESYIEGYEENMKKFENPELTQTQDEILFWLEEKDNLEALMENRDLGVNTKQLANILELDYQEVKNAVIGLSRRGYLFSNNGVLSIDFYYLLFRMINREGGIQSYRKNERKTELESVQKKEFKLSGKNLLLARISGAVLGFAIVLLFLGK